MSRVRPRWLFGLIIDPMTPRPRRFLLFALICTSVFALLAVLVEAGAFVVALDADLVRAMHNFAVERPAVHSFFVFVTNLGTGRPLWVIGAIAIALHLITRQWFRALVWTVGLLAADPVTPFFKNQFGRVRPPFADIDGFSFPSGHAFGSAVAYGMLALAVLHVVRNH